MRRWPYTDEDDQSINEHALILVGAQDLVFVKNLLAFLLGVQDIRSNIDDDYFAVDGRVIKKEFKDRCETTVALAVYFYRSKIVMQHFIRIFSGDAGGRNATNFATQT